MPHQKQENVRRREGESWSKISLSSHMSFRAASCSHRAPIACEHATSLAMKNKFTCKRAVVSRSLDFRIVFPRFSLLSSLCLLSRSVLSSRLLIAVDENCLLMLLPQLLLTSFAAAHFSLSPQLHLFYFLAQAFNLPHQSLGNSSSNRLCARGPGILAAAVHTCLLSATRAADGGRRLSHGSCCSSTAVADVCCYMACYSTVAQHPHYPASAAPEACCRRINL